MNSIILGTGRYLPSNVVTNHDLAQRMDTNHEWIVERTGIHERRFAIPGVDTTASMGTEAAKRALDAAGLSPHDVDLILFATLSPDYYFPGPGVQLQHNLGCRTIGAIDIRNQCSGFVYALSIADQYLRNGAANHVLVVGSELHSGGLDMSTRGRNVSVIFGDGAGAVVLGRTDEPGRGLLSTHLHSQGEHAEELALLGPSTRDWIPEIIQRNDPEDVSYFPRMNGNFVFKHAVVRFAEVIEEALTSNQLSTSDLRLLIPHQANLRIAQFIQQKLGLREDQVYNNIMRYGNTTAASIPIALSEAFDEGRIQKGDLLMMAAFGSGFTWGSALMRW
ncbi:MAG: ketoacyl-ACP synthase III [Sphingobacteriia bacterium]|nr:ketoacyl-ACP synthase III [Sphingobacteriia bacterium]